MVFIFIELEGLTGKVLLNLPTIGYIAEESDTTCMIATPAGAIVVKHTRQEVMTMMQNAMKQANSRLLVAQNMPPPPILGQN